ncbi:L-histidine N(alpha)-methyltransferase [Hahella sp. NBU794]|uniref:L-histidine N(alpha)-methyltransferase n=1 Tax=Hahella sp. NBU794 TaxID=3422590 RepID=UPI003D6E7031
MIEPVIKDLCEHEVIDEAFLADVVQGLSGWPKTLPCKYFYDQRGSELFEQICDVDEYYLTRTEMGMIDYVAREMAQRLPHIGQIVEFGCGNCEKIQRLLDAHPQVDGFVAIDVSETFLLESVKNLSQRYPALTVTPVVGDFMEAQPLPDATGPRMGFFPGSTIGNLEAKDARRFLYRVGRTLGEGGYLLVGVDTLKDRRILLRAYDDASGVTREFNLNLLRRMQQELGAELTLEQFAHEARFNETKSRIEMHLRSLCDQFIAVGGKYFHLSKDETIHTENSHKYTVERFQDLAASAGWQSRRVWLAEDDMYSMHLLQYEGGVRMTD